MVVVDLIVMAGYTGLASKVLRALKTPRQQRRLNRAFASLFVGAAGFLATLHRGTA
ncbi:Homoserine/homoserine lactone efflux protein [Pseudomonas syringae pv. primulae]|uniref:Homoserine/homoserine lactone efflux protein n=1 Tax=Pseudomonas syringae pv. primulae TaxID=251707 RepID=A0A3M5U704_9PSED|nr:Homoserine/homoserine lactone efflux protein [Pseudomonas syringae pv. primulae]RMU41442.1 Homoserine/homoserine lactone efflux protein [Pseudomonas syringae pv. primulae]